MSATQDRLERYAEARQRTSEKIQDIHALAEEGQRALNEHEQEQIAKYRTQISEYEAELQVLAEDIKRENNSLDVSALVRRTPAPDPQQRPDALSRPDDPALAGGGPVYATFARYARDELIVRYPMIATAAGGDAMGVVEGARQRLEELKKRAPVNTTSQSVPGLIVPAHLNEILDIINTNRPVVATARNVNLNSGQLTYPQITQRPLVTKQGTVEKTEAGLGTMSIAMVQIAAETYLGAGDLSWQTLQWSSPDALALWFELMAEQYARSTETAACTELTTNGGGTTTYKLGTSGTEDFNAWRQIIMGGIAAIFAATGGRAQTDVLYLSADYFFSLAGLGTANVLQLSSVGGLDVSSLTGTYSGLKVVGSYGFANHTALLGDQSAFLIGENQGAPVEMRVVEPNIGGLQVGVIGAMKAKVFDPLRFIHIA